jgi:hypothetical protein
LPLGSQRRWGDGIYTISVDTKITSKVLELLLFPLFVAVSTGRCNTI